MVQQFFATVMMGMLCLTNRSMAARLTVADSMSWVVSLGCNTIWWTLMKKRQAWCNISNTIDVEHPIVKLLGIHLQ